MLTAPSLLRTPPRRLAPRGRTALPRARGTGAAVLADVAPARARLPRRRRPAGRAARRPAGRGRRRPGRAAARRARSSPAPTSSSSPRVPPAAAAGVLLSAGALRASADRHPRPARRPGRLAARAAGLGHRRAAGAVPQRAGRPAAHGARARARRLAAAVARMPAGRRYTALVPTQLRRALDAEPGALAAFDAVLVGGAATDPALLDRARAAGVAVVTTYGMTETAGGCVYDGVPLAGVRGRAWRTTACGWPARCWRSATGSTPRAPRPRSPAAGSAPATPAASTPTAGWRCTAGWTTSSSPAGSTSRRSRSRRRCASTPTWPTRSSSAARTPSGAAGGGRGGARRRRRPRLAGCARGWPSGSAAAAAPRELHRIDAVPLLHTGKPDRRGVARRRPVG